MHSTGSRGLPLAPVFLSRLGKEPFYPASQAFRTHIQPFSGNRFRMATSAHHLCGPDCPDSVTITQNDAPSFGAGQTWAIRKYTLSGGLSQGVEVVEANNGSLTAYIIPTRGMGLWKIEQGDTRIGWDAPAERPVHPMFVNCSSRNKLGWLDGFNELLCRCGLSFNGPPGEDGDALNPLEADITLHGRIANKPAEWVDAELTEAGIIIRGLTLEHSLFGVNLALETEYLLPWGEATLEVNDSVTNRASGPAEMQLLYHINVGTPLVEAGGTWNAPLQNVYCRDPRASEQFDEYPQIYGPTAGYAEQVYFCDLAADDAGRSLAMLQNKAGEAGFAVEFDLQTLPCLSVWKNTQALSDGYCVGLEPGTNFPNHKSVERQNNRVVTIPAGDTWKTSLELKLLATSADVQGVAGQIQRLQGEHSPGLHDSQKGLTEGL